MIKSFLGGKEKDEDENSEHNESGEASSNLSKSESSLIPQSVKRFGVKLPGMTKTRSAESESSPSGAPSGSFSVRKFDGKNFEVWKSQMEAYLSIKDCDYVLTQSRPILDSVAQSAYDDKEKFARAVLLLSLGDDQAILVCHLKTAREIWTRLLEAHEQTSKVSSVVMQRKFFEATMGHSEKVVEFVSRLQRIYTQLVNAGSNMTEETLVARVVSGLPPRFHVFMTNWSNDTSVKQTMAELLPRLMSEEQLMKGFDKTENIAMLGETSQSNSSTHEKYQRTRVNQSKPASQKKRVKCYNCRGIGHIARECKKPRREKHEQPKEAVVAEGMTAETEIAQCDNWIIDSGASSHMSNDTAGFISFHKLSAVSTVKMGDSGELPIIGIGDVKMIASDKHGSREFILWNVLYVPGIRRKLISVHAATSNGVSGVIKQNEILLKKNGKTLLTGLKRDGLYFAQATEAEVGSTAEVNNLDQAHELMVDDNAEQDSDAKLWHERLAHMSFSTISKMQKNESVIGLEAMKIDSNPKVSDRRVVNCEACCLAKHARTPVPLSQRSRATTVGERVHVDICGPVGAETVAGSRYFILFKDEYSNFRFIYTMKSREEAFGLIRRCVNSIEAIKNYKVKSLFSDRGSEFTSNRTQTYLEEKGIVHNTSAAFTPHQNGFIERDNRTVMEACRAMLFHSRLPEALWGEAVAVAVYILNRTINNNTGGKTPYELFYGQKPRVSHLRVFGSECFAKMQEKKRSGYQRKLDARSRKLVLVGYKDDRDFTYKLFDMETREFIFSREVIFNEHPQVKNQQISYDKIDQVIDTMKTTEGNGTTTEGESNLTESHIEIEEPASYDEAIKSKQAKLWKQAMQEEYDSLIKNGTWSMEDLPPNMRAIKNKWVFKVKRDSMGRVARYKARLCACGYSQRQGIDYSETFSPVVRMESVRFILSIVAERDLEFAHFDVRTAFLYGKLTETVFMQQPRGYEAEGGKVCRLLKSIYGLKQASRVWNQTFSSFLKNFDLSPMLTDSCVYVRRAAGVILIIALYVDDGLVCCSDKKLLNQVIEHLKSQFDISLMEPECFVGIQIVRDRSKSMLTIHQSNYIERLSSRFELDKAKPANVPMSSAYSYTSKGTADGADSKQVDAPYRELIGSLNYAMVATRPDIACAVSILARFCQCPKLPHWMAAKQILRYLFSTKSLGICYDGKAAGYLSSYSDADFASCRDSRKSISGYTILRCGGAIIWKSTKQSTVAESTAEAELVACSSASREVMWCRHFLEELDGKPIRRPVELKVDNQSALRIIKNNQIHSKIKHLDIRVMAVREREEREWIDTSYVDTTEQVADIFTKPLPAKQFCHLRTKLGMALLALLVITLVSEVHGFTLNLKLKEVEDSILHRVVLKLYSPCLDTHAVEEAIRGPVTTQGPNMAKFRIDNLLIEYTDTICKDIFEQKVRRAMLELESCQANSTRSKRDITAVVNAASMIAAAVTGVTNLIRGSSISSAPDSDGDLQQKQIQRLSRQTHEATKTTLTNKVIMARELERELAIISESVPGHQDLIQEVLDQAPMLTWVSTHIFHELYAGEANLKAIHHQCQLGMLATAELGEMLESRQLSGVQSHRTRLERISVDALENTIEFLYYVESTVDISVLQLLSWLGGTIVFLAAIVVLYAYTKSLTLQARTRQNDVATVVVRPRDKLALEF